MGANALSKGCADRTALRKFFEQSRWELDHEVKSWTFKHEQ